MPWKPAVIELGECYFVTWKGAMMMSTMIVRLENLSVNQICKIFDRFLSPLIRHYKNKRPPPASG
jgi:hypothetical protein